MSISRDIVAVGLLLLCTGPGIVSAQTSPGRALQDVKTLKCEFTLMATGTWTREGAPQAEVKPGKVLLTFSDIDTQSGSAEIEGTVGSPSIVVQLSGGYLHFMQIGSNGFLYTTTVFNKPARPGRLKAVHTRHEFTEVALPGYTSRPEQYYGDCEAGQ